MIFGYKINNSYLILCALVHILTTISFFIYHKINDSDSSYYWYLLPEMYNINLVELFGFNNRFILLLNYPFASLLKIPFWSGTIIYSTIGFFAIIQVFKLLKFLVGEKLLIRQINVLPFILLLPNWHFWTSGITKEVLCLLVITTVFLKVHQNKWFSWQLITSFIALTLIRPHMSFVLTAGIGCSFLILASLSRKQKLIYSLALVLLLFLLYFLVCQIINIDPWDIERWIINNQRWRDSFIGSGSYVPIQDYNYPYKFFTFYFRPFFYDIHHPFSWILSVENLFIFTLFLWSCYNVIKYFKRINWNVTIIAMLLFNVIGAFIYVQRYAGLGIFARTRVMFVPFLIITMLFIVSQTRNSKLINGQT